MVTDHRGRQSAVSVERILKFRERPKPGSERSLMVVIEGLEGSRECQVYCDGH
jgi:hypothetical protein